MKILSKSIQRVRADREDSVFKDDSLVDMLRECVSRNSNNKWSNNEYETELDYSIGYGIVFEEYYTAGDMSGAPDNKTGAKVWDIAENDITEAVNDALGDGADQDDIDEAYFEYNIVKSYSFFESFSKPKTIRFTFRIAPYYEGDVLYHDKDYVVVSKDFNFDKVPFEKFIQEVAKLIKKFS